eukprot:RCo048357
MRIYKDLICGDELVTDAFPMKELHDGAVLEVDAKYITVTAENDFNIGANASADGQDEGDALENQAQQVINLVHFNRLKETSIDKKSYMAHVKEYMGKVKAKVAADRQAAFQAGATAFVKKVLAEFDEYTFYQGESMDPESMTILCRFSEDGMSQKFYFWKDGMKEEKV